METYNGGKSGSGTYQQIINYIPPHNIYIELFAGHIGIFRKIRRSPISILNDVDPAVIKDISDFLLKDTSVTVWPDFFQGNLFEKPIKPVVILRNNDYKVILDRFKENTDAFIYCDPPYPMHKRLSQAALYKFDWEQEEQHADFLTACSSCKCAVMISSFPNDQYNTALAGWHKHFYTSPLRTGKKQDEVIYMNYPKPVVLHDFQYLGSNYRKRSWIKAKVKRHINKLNKMPEQERTALLSAIFSQFKETTETLIRL